MRVIGTKFKAVGEKTYWEWVSEAQNKKKKRRKQLVQILMKRRKLAQFMIDEERRLWGQIPLDK